jgi:hypothetical protein
MAAMKGHEQTENEIKTPPNQPLENQDFTRIKQIQHDFQQRTAQYQSALSPVRL